MGSIMVGEMMGPLIGSALYKNFGYFYQFIVLVVVHLLTMIAVYFIIPDER